MQIQAYSESWQLDIFIYTEACSEPMAYSGIFKTVDIFSQFQALLKSNLSIFWTLFR